MSQENARQKLKIRQMHRMLENLGRIKKASVKLLAGNENQRRLGYTVLALYELGARPGRAQNKKSQGLTTLTWKNLKMTGHGKVILSYVGKKGVHQLHFLSNSRVVAAMKKSSRNSAPFAPVAQLRAFLKQFGVRPKDFRTWRANNHYLRLIKTKMSQTDALQKTASFLGHSASTLKKHYLLEPSVMNLTKQDQ